MSRAPTKANQKTVRQKASKTGAKKRKAPLAGRGGVARKVAAGKPALKKVKGKSPGKSKDGLEDEQMSQVTIKLRQSQHRQLAEMAFDAGTTMRGIIMRALKSKGLAVTEDDLKDRRRR